MVRTVRTPHGILIENDDPFIDTLAGISSYRDQPKKPRKKRDRKRKEVAPRPEPEAIQLGETLPETLL